LHTKRLVCNLMSDTREYIIDQAYRLFLSRSYEAVSISEISKAIGFTKGALYHHFKNKEELFKAVINKYLPIEKYFTPIEEISLKEFIDVSIKTADQIVHTIFSNKSGFIPLTYLALYIDAFRHYPEFAKEKDRLIQGELEKIKGIIIKSIEKGEIRKDINPDFMALNLFSLATGMAGNLMQNYSPALAIDMLRNQFYELYKIMKVQEEF
jgi:TetR/AcrR family transcriptional regulator, transcriptional repressor for nem operon